MIFLTDLYSPVVHKLPSCSQSPPTSAAAEVVKLALSETQRVSEAFQGVYVR